MKKLWVLLIVLFLHKEAASQDLTIGAGFYIPEKDLLGQDLVGGRSAYKNVDQCKNTSPTHNIDTAQTSYTSTTEFYSAVTTDTSISGSLQSDFTLGATLQATSKSVAGNTNRVKGFTYQSYSKVSVDYLDPKCLEGLDLDDTLTKKFESLPKDVSRPSEKNSWVEYQNFLQQFGSHLVTEVHRGASIYQHAFSRESESYSAHDFKIKACINLVAPTEAGLANASICTGVTKEDIKRVSEFQMTSRFIARGGTDETRAKLSDISQRSDTLIAKFLSEAEATDQPVTYKFMSIWTLLKTRYIDSSEHLVRALNLEAYYKGYLNFGCREVEQNNYVFQKFVSTSQSELPSYACQLAPQGCHQDYDCSYNIGIFCQCGGKTCVRHGEKELSTDKKKPYAYPYQGEGWGGRGCIYWAFQGCYCSEPSSTWRTIWSTSEDALRFTLLLHHKSKGLKSTKANDEL